MAQAVKQIVVLHYKLERSRNMFYPLAKCWTLETVV